MISEKTNIEIDYTRRLPEAEFDVMSAIWRGTPPVNTAYLMEEVGREKGWKAPTLISFLVRLQDRGFITSEKHGKERYYTPVADRDTYIHEMTEQFIAKYHGGSFISMLEAFYTDDNFTENDIDDLLIWLKSKC